MSFGPAPEYDPDPTPFSECSCVTLEADVEHALLRLVKGPLTKPKSRSSQASCAALRVAPRHHAFHLRSRSGPEGPNRIDEVTRWLRMQSRTDGRPKAPVSHAAANRSNDSFFTVREPEGSCSGAGTIVGPRRNPWCNLRYRATRR